MSTQKLADFILQMSYEQLPADAIEISRRSLLDCIGVALAGSREEAGKIVRSVAIELGGQPVSGVIGGGFRTSPVLAALANGTSAHALDYDDQVSWHPSVVLVPTVLAMGERCASSGKEILTAYITGLEIGTKLCVTIGNSHYYRGWHNTATVGSLGAAAAVARLLGLNSQQIRIAFGIAASLTSGLRGNFGTMTKPLHPGNSARNGILAGLLAEKGFTANTNILEDPLGFLRVLGEDPEYDLDGMCRQLGSPFAAISPGVWHKSYPCCASNHATIDAAIELRKQHSFNPEDIVEVECATNKQTPEVLFHHRPKKGLEGKFSLEYNVSRALIDGAVTLHDFTDEKVLAPEVQRLIPKVKYTHPPEIADKTGPRMPGMVTVRLQNGEVLCSKIEFARGMPQNPMTDSELHFKFESCARAVLSKKEIVEVISLVADFENLKDIRRLMDIITG